jgi:hypothetical protein
MMTLDFARHQTIERPEFALVACCGWPRPDGRVADATRLILRQPIDWNLFLREASRHRLVPLAYRHLSAFPDCAPAQVLDALRRDFRRSAKRNLVITAEMLRVVDQLAVRGIRAVPIKGPLLSIAAFGDLAMRQFADIDILVHPRDVQHAKTMLTDGGYAIEHVLSAGPEAEYIRSEHAFRFTRPDGDVLIELHWRLIDRRLACALDDEIWEHLQQTNFHGRSLLTLREDDLFLYLCVHGAKHYWENIEWISCLAALLQRRPEWDWDSIVQRAVSMGARRVLQLALLLVSDFGASPVAAVPLQLMKRDPVAESLANTVWQRVFAPELEGTAREVYRYEFYLRARERMADRLRVLRHCSVRIPHPDSKDWSLYPVPKSLQFLYYAIRPIRLLKENGIQPLKSALLPR